jgi:membrane protein DedA with SNARE-associated domain
MISSVAAAILSMPVWLVLLVAFSMPALESSAFVGFVFPGEAALVVAGVVAGQGRVAVELVMLAGVLGAVLGDAVGYFVGRRWGPALLAHLPQRFFPPERIERASTYLAQRGGKAVFVGRFTATLRVLIPGLAGMSGMAYRKFAIANVSSAIGWGVLSVLLGYWGGSNWHHLTSTVGRLALIGVGALVLGAIAAHVVRGRARRRAPVPAGQAHRVD